MSFVGRQFAPVVPMQKIVGGCKSDLSAEMPFESLVNLSNHEYAATFRLLKEWLQNRPSLFYLFNGQTTLKNIFFTSAAASLSAAG